MAAGSPSPIVFADADTSLQVFHQAFHVNSTILKVHSEFFRKFLDSPDKKSSESASTARTFKYEWVTEVDDDGKGWTLTAKEKSSPQAQAKSFKGKVAEQVHAFQMMMQALHFEPIAIRTAAELCLVTKLSDFYRMLPVISNALHGVFYGNHDLVSAIAKNCVAMLEASHKLRNKVLFRECYVHVMNPASQPKYLSMPNGRLKSLCIAGQHKHQALLNDLQLEILLLEMNDPSNYGFLGETARAKKAASRFLLTGQKIALPHYYKHLLENALPAEPLTGHRIRALFQTVLQNKLVLDRSSEQAGGDGIYKDSFLCFELTGQELPWNVNERVW